MNFSTWIRRSARRKLIQIKKLREKWGKTDWLILILLGVLLMIIAIPTGKEKGASTGETATAVRSGADRGTLSDSMARSTGGTTSAAGTSETDGGGKDSSAPGGSSGTDGSSDRRREGLAYAASLEEELAAVLTQIAGVGKVSIMITLDDEGETIVNKDIASSGDSREESTTLIEDDIGTLPYVTKLLYPRVEGVIVVAEGAQDGAVKTQIMEAVMALFALDAHKVFVLPMG